MGKRISPPNLERITLFPVFLMLLGCCACSGSGSQDPPASQLGSSPAASPVLPTQTAPSPPTGTPEEASPTPSPVQPPALTPTPASAFQLINFDQGISPVEIRDLWVAPGGHLWVATEAGIFAYINGVGA